MSMCKEGDFPNLLSSNILTKHANTMKDGANFNGDFEYSVLSQQNYLFTFVYE